MKYVIWAILVLILLGLTAPVAWLLWIMCQMPHGGCSL